MGTTTIRTKKLRDGTVIRVRTVASPKPSYGEWAQYIAKQARQREGVEGLRVKREFD